MPRRIALSLVLVAVFVTSLAFVGSATAHQISLKAAVRKAAAHGQEVVNQRPDYLKRRAHCRYKFKGHSHYALCTVTYETASDVNACQEKMEGRISPEQSNTSLFGIGHLGRACH